MKTKLYRHKGWDSDFPLAENRTSFVHHYGDYYINITEPNDRGYIAIQRLTDDKRVIVQEDELEEITSSKNIPSDMKETLAHALGWRFIMGFVATNYKWTSPTGQWEYELPEELLKP